MGKEKKNKEGQLGLLAARREKQAGHAAGLHVKDMVGLWARTTVGLLVAVVLGSGLMAVGSAGLGLIWCQFWAKEPVEVGFNFGLEWIEISLTKMGLIGLGP